MNCVPLTRSLKGFFVFLFFLQLQTVLDALTIDEIISNAAKSSNEIARLFSDGEVKLENDMIFTGEQWRQIQQSRNGQDKNRHKRKAIRSLRYRWPDKTIPYEISFGQFGNRDQSEIQAAIAEWEKYTCIQFRPARRTDGNKIVFQNGGGCSSYVGMAGGARPVTLGRGCRVKRVIVHELGHAVGFQHEQTRPDRERYVTVNTRNVPSSVLFNFEKYTTFTINDYGVPYDYESIMHYGQYAFSINGQRTIVTKDRRYQNVIGNGRGLSFKDIKLANLMYSCAANCATRSCPGEGFVGKDCKCYCPGSPLQLCSDENDETTATTSKTTSATTRTTETTTKATTTTARCTDSYSLCRSWSYRGDCRRNPGFMNTYCKRSCKRCDGDGGRDTCADLSRYCTSWARKGYCTNRLYTNYLQRTCQKSCNYCNDENEIRTDVVSKTVFG